MTVYSHPSNQPVPLQQTEQVIYMYLDRIRIRIRNSRTGASSPSPLPSNNPDRSAAAAV